MTPRKLHPLHTPEFLDQQVRTSGHYADTTRCTGRTTAIALSLIAQAIDNPNEAVRIVDHAGTRPAHDHLARQILSICEALRLEHMQVRPKALTLTFERAMHDAVGSGSFHFQLYRDRSRM